jgi:hypothetical protein
MTPSKDILDESAFIIREIESNLDKALQQRRDEIERDLQERIRQEREEHERRLSKVEQDFARERETVQEYRATITDFEKERDSLQFEIKEHLDASVGFQKEIERLTALTLEELRIVAGKSARLSEIRDRTEEKVTEIRTKLREKYGIVTEERLPPADTDLVVNLEQELEKLKRIKELLEADVSTRPSEFSGPAVSFPVASEPAPVPGPEPEAAPVPEPSSGPEAVAEATAAGAATLESEPVPEPEPIFEPEPIPGPEDRPKPAEEEARPTFKIPEINQFIEDFVRRESLKDEEPEFAPPGPAQPKNEDRRAVYEELNFQAVFEALEKYRKSEPTDYNGEINYFQNRGRSILDGESLVRAVGHILDEARKLYTKLGQAESPKDQFFIKQELINNQEILRKIVLRAVKLCEREGYTLPRFTEDILNLAGLKETLDKLNMDNWSCEDDFRSFETTAGRLKDAFYKKITPPAQYLRSIVHELEE